MTEKAGTQAYTIGQKVTVRNEYANKDETFYVIENSDKTKENVTLLAFENIDTKNFVQSSSANTVAFSTGNYWGDSEIIEPATIPEDHIAAYAAFVYGEKVGGTGKLMTKTDLEKLLNVGQNIMIYGIEANNGYLSYWLGSAGDSTDFVWTVSGQFWQANGVDGEYSIATEYGVRPVVEISKSKVSLVQ